jgi:GMP synthase (glutamine-hydrolysing)
MDKIAVIDFGGQYAHLIANRIRRLKVFSEILPPTTPVSELDHKGLIFSGGPSSVYAPDQPKFNPGLLNSGVPLLGICYGHQLICLHSRSQVTRGKVHEFGASLLKADISHPLFQGRPEQTRVWMSHGDEVTRLPEDFYRIGTTSDCTYAAVANDNTHTYGLQFHPEVTHTEEGNAIFDNFLDICEADREWDMEHYYQTLKERVKEKCGNKKVFLLVSGGVDSTVTFALLNNILGPENVLGLHIDNGLMRKNESSDVLEYMKTQGFDNLTLCDAGEQFLEQLKGVTSPERKRKIIGDLFIDVMNQEIAKLNMDSGSWLMAQGTTYPDTIESGGTKHAAVIKTHHNRVPVILELLEKGMIIEPVAELYKDEIRALGTSLGLPDKLVWRHPFPGPGLGVRLLCRDDEEILVKEELDYKVSRIMEQTIIEYQVLPIKSSGKVFPIKSVGVQGDSRTYAHPCLLRGIKDWDLCEKFSTEMTNNIRDINRIVLEIDCEPEGEYSLVPLYCEKPRLDFLREADAICTEALIEYNLYRDIWQMPVVLLPITKNQKPVIVMRPINSAEAMTASFAQIDFDILSKIWAKLQTLGAGALWYDITHKPPGTIEWE